MKILCAHYVRRDNRAKNCINPLVCAEIEGDAKFTIDAWRAVGGLRKSKRGVDRAIDSR